MMFMYVILTIEVTIHPVSTLTAIALEDITLSCSASVDGVKYSWHRVDGHIPSYPHGWHNDTFAINRVIPHDEGMYYCVAKKNNISAQSNSISVQVNGKV